MRNWTRLCQTKYYISVWREKIGDHFREKSKFLDPLGAEKKRAKLGKNLLLVRSASLWGCLWLDWVILLDWPQLQNVVFGARADSWRAFPSQMWFFMPVRCAKFWPYNYQKSWPNNKWCGEFSRVHWDRQGESSTECIPRGIVLSPLLLFSR